jgi:hypothetical protein
VSTGVGAACLTGKLASQHQTVQGGSKCFGDGSRDCCKGALVGFMRLPPRRVSSVVGYHRLDTTAMDNRLPLGGHIVDAYRGWTRPSDTAR